jgi:hypothetical protein
MKIGPRKNEIIVNYVHSQWQKCGNAVNGHTACGKHIPGMNIHKKTVLPRDSKRRRCNSFCLKRAAKRSRKALLYAA